MTRRLVQSWDRRDDFVCHGPKPAVALHPGLMTGMAQVDDIEPVQRKIPSAVGTLECHKRDLAETDRGRGLLGLIEHLRPCFYRKGSGDRVGNPVQNEDVRCIAQGDAEHPEREIDDAVPFPHKPGPIEMDEKGLFVQAHLGHGPAVGHCRLKRHNHVENGPLFCHLLAVEKEKLQGLGPNPKGMQPQVDAAMGRKGLVKVFGLELLDPLVTGVRAEDPPEDHPLDPPVGRKKKPLFADQGLGDLGFRNSLLEDFFDPDHVFSWAYIGAGHAGTTGQAQRTAAVLAVHDRALLLEGDLSPALGALGGDEQVHYRTFSPQWLQKVASGNISPRHLGHVR